MLNSKGNGLAAAAAHELDLDDGGRPAERRHVHRARQSAAASAAPVMRGGELHQRPALDQFLVVAEQSG